MKDITKDLKKLGIKNQNVLDKCKALNFPVRIVMKAKNQEQYDKWVNIFNQFNKNYPKY